MSAIRTTRRSATFAEALPASNAARITEASVRRATGGSRDNWFALLDASGAVKRMHKDIVAWLMNEYGVDGWWAQSLTVEYEQARGLRPRGGNRDGTFNVNASRTLAVPVKRLYQAFAEAKVREKWLPGAVLKERTSQANRSIRFDWQSGATRVIVGFSATDRRKSVVSVLHERLPDARRAAEMKAYWRDRLGALKERLENSV